MKLPIQPKNRATGSSTSPSHSPTSRSHCGGSGGGGAGWRLNWIGGIGLQRLMRRRQPVGGARRVLRILRDLTLPLEAEN